MARARIFGSDVPFCSWLRGNESLPAFSATCGFVATDVDLFIHRYLTEVDAMGTREVQALMFLEIKTRSGDPSKSQLDTLYKIHTSSPRRPVSIGSEVVRHLGVSVVKLSGLTPDDSTIHWGRFSDDGDGKRRLSYRQVDVRTLLGLMRFEIHPDNFARQPFRRHHRTRVVVQVVTAPLGFEYEQELVKAS